jgi:hypothetical protein
MNMPSEALRTLQGESERLMSIAEELSAIRKNLESSLKILAHVEGDLQNQLGEFRAWCKDHLNEADWETIVKVPF